MEALTLHLSCNIKHGRLLIYLFGLLGGWVGGPTVIIGLVSVQVELKLDLPTGTEFGKKDITFA